MFQVNRFGVWSESCLQNCAPFRRAKRYLFYFNSKRVEIKFRANLIVGPISIPFLHRRICGKVSRLETQFLGFFFWNLKIYFINKVACYLSWQNFCFIYCISFCSADESKKLLCLHAHVMHYIHTFDYQLFISF